jgi:3-oxoacyl-[acyl-carrier-protein] synthase II
MGSSGADNRVVITGAGPIASVGIGREDFLQGLFEGREGVGPSERLADTGAFAAVAECFDFAAEDFLVSKKTYLDRCAELVLCGCILALGDAGLDYQQIDSERLGISLGTAFGCLESMTNHSARVQAKGVRFGSPMIFTHTMANAPTSIACIEYGIRGPAATWCAGSASGACALEFALRRVREGDTDIMLAGGADALSSVLLAGLSPESGIVPGEGACMLVLEPYERALTRGARILAELVSVSVTGSAGDEHATTPAYGHTFGASVPLSVCAGMTAENAGRTLRAGPAADEFGVRGPGAEVVIVCGDGQ